MQDGEEGFGKRRGEGREVKDLRRGREIKENFEQGYNCRRWWSLVMISIEGR